MPPRRAQPQPQPRPRPRTRRRGSKQAQEGDVAPVDENNASLLMNSNNSGTETLRTSTPVRLRAPLHRRSERKREVLVEDSVPPVNEDSALSRMNNDTRDASLDLAVADHLQTSTPVRLPPPSRKRGERKPIQRRELPSTLPPSSPPFAASPRREIPVEESIPPLAKEDPFGLLAAERRLKAKRSLEQMSKQKRSPVKEHESNDAASPALAAAAQAAADWEPEFELDLSTFVSGTHTPPGHTPDPRAATPRHHRPRQRKIPTTPPSQEEDLFPILQTPSPTKRVSTSIGPEARRPFANIAHLNNSPAKASTPAPAPTKGKKRSRKGGDGAARKKGKTDETLAEVELKGMTEELKELLPSRPKRRAAASAQRKSVVPVASGAKAKKRAVPGKGDGRKDRKKDGKSRSSAKGKRVKATAEDKEEEGESFVLSGEEREKYSVDREGRKEYFRGIDEYVMEEESVYVI